MPGIVDGVVNELNVDSPSHKENSGVNRSPKSTLSAHSTRSTGNDLPPDEVVDTSIEKLYENVCDMQSSDQSPSRRSFRSDGEESRIDSELRHLVGGEMTEVEIMEEEVHSKPMDDSLSDSSSKKEGSPLGRKKGLPLGRKSGKIDKAVDDSHSDSSSKKGSSPLGKKSGKMDKSRSPSTNATSPGNSKKVGRMQADAETSSKSVAKGKSPDKPPIRKPSDKSLQKHGGATPLRKLKNSPSGVSKIQNGTEDAASDLGPFLLKQARDLISAGDNPQKALELALRATKSFEISANGKPCLELVMCLHVTSAIYCSLGQYSEAIPILEQSIEISPIEEDQDHALAKFAGHMQLGDTYAMLGQLENSLAHYTTGLEIQKQVLGETDPRVGETCRYLAEAHVQALQFDEAQRLCQMALDSHKENGAPATLEEAADRRLMGLICETKGDHEAALEHLVLASMAMVANGQEVEVASVDSSIGDTYLSLSRYDEAIFAYQKALTVFKTTKGENHPSVGSVFIRLADLYNKTGKIRESIAYCENALRIYEKPMPGVPPEEMASGLTDVSAIYESMNELEQAVKLLQKALKIYNDAPGQQSTIAGIEAQMGVMYYMLENYSESYESFKRAISKLRATGEKKSAFFGIVLNQMGLACVQRYDITEAQEFFEEARTVLEHECGPYHPDTLGVYSNLAGTYDAVGRLDDAIELLEFVVGMREEKLGTANPDVDDEKRRLAELLKETGRVRNRKTRSLENLLDSNSRSIITNGIKV